MSTESPAAVKYEIPPAMRVAVIAARFNATIVDELLSGCVARLKEMGVEDSRLQTYRVPGAFELPLAAKWLAQSRRYAAIICLGAVIRGDTPHFDFVAGECAAGIARVSLDEAIPVIFGVLTTNTVEQAEQRTGGVHGHAGVRAAEAAAEMIAVQAQISTLPPEEPIFGLHRKPR
jgi:6,7-dimethyl-8-ribityllumazine synthase